MRGDLGRTLAAIQFAEALSHPRIRQRLVNIGAYLNSEDPAAVEGHCSRIEEELCVEIADEKAGEGCLDDIRCRQEDCLTAGLGRFTF